MKGLLAPAACLGGLVGNDSDIFIFSVGGRGWARCGDVSTVVIYLFVLIRQSVIDGLINAPNCPTNLLPADKDLQSRNIPSATQLV